MYAAYIALSWKTTLITWIFLRGWYPTSDTSGPPGDSVLYFNSHLVLWVSRQTCQLLKAFTLHKKVSIQSYETKNQKFYPENDSTLVDFIPGGHLYLKLDIILVKKKKKSRN